MDRLTYRNDDGRARLTLDGMKMFCSSQATADYIANLEEQVAELVRRKDCMYCCIDGADAFTTGFDLGLKEGYASGVNDGLRSAARTCAKSDWKLEGGGEE